MKTKGKKGKDTKRGLWWYNAYCSSSYTLDLEQKCSDICEKM